MPDKKRSYQKTVKTFMIVFICFLFPSQMLMAQAIDKDLNIKFKSLGMIPLYHMMSPADDPVSDIDGNPIKLSDFRGKIVFLNFWTTWCPDCVYEMPDIEKLQNKLKKKKKDFIIIAMDLRESKEKVQSFVRKYGLTFTVLLDQKGSMGRAFGIRSIPTTFVLDRQGGMIGKALGPRDWDSRKSMDLFTYILEHY